MNINATLFVQIVNFGIAYVLLRVLLLKPAVAAIQHDEQTQSSLVDQIAQSEKEVQALRDKRYQLWYACHAHFVRTSPPVLARVQRAIPVHRVTVQPMSEQERTQLIDEVHVALTERIGGAHE